MLNHFLDYVEKENGRLIIVGDLFELWRFDFHAILDRHEKLIERLGFLTSAYICGNHDNILFSARSRLDFDMKLLQKIREPFSCTIGSRRFKFAHGHEVDPFMPEMLQNLGRFLGNVTCFLETSQSSCILTNDVISDILLETGEYLLSGWHWLTIRVNDALYGCSAFLGNEELAKLKRPIRTRKMLGRYLSDLREGLYDVAVVGHTHREGRFENWYYNSGSWTGNSNNFLKILPDGNVATYNWHENVPYPNQSVIGCSSPVNQLN